MVIVSQADLLARLDSYRWTFHRDGERLNVAVDFSHIPHLQESAMWLTAVGVSETLPIRGIANRAEGDPLPVLAGVLLARACDRLGADTGLVSDPGYDAVIAEYHAEAGADAE
ncbi:hypothetical protein [Bifidobacterium myosotis]|uniref:Uncharacterized protein n=1 Tax=Bifidobacterium myosotis TaxID=1630166 RepID=A0A5M9ZKK1_9BIFI|nr:hypothetical protein [Bifidobacterium myosotis]KAA8828146.1 hypothetical protein EMO91_06815 [Bifidobacterium myosotis]